MASKVQTTHSICFCHPHCHLHIETRGVSPGLSCCSQVILLSSLCQAGISKLGGVYLLSVGFLSFPALRAFGNPLAFLYLLQDSWQFPLGVGGLVSLAQPAVLGTPHHVVFSSEILSCYPSCSVSTGGRFGDTTTMLLLTTCIEALLIKMLNVYMI